MKIFSKHSLERLVQRNIDRQTIIDIPDVEFYGNTRQDAQGNYILHKINEDKLLRLFYKIDENKNIFIITAYITSNIDKYQK